MGLAASDMNTNTFSNFSQQLPISKYFSGYLANTVITIIRVADADTETDMTNTGNLFAMRHKGYMGCKKREEKEKKRGKESKREDERE